MDLDLLVGEVTFGMNRVDLVYEPAPDYGIRGTRWRPTYYLFLEWLGSTNPEVPTVERQYEVVGGDEDPWLFDRQHPKHVHNNPFRDFVIPHHLAPGIEKCILRSAHMPVFDDAVKVDRRWRGRRLPPAMWIPATCPHAGMYVKSERRPTEWHLPVWCKYGGTMNIALQFAFAMGFDPIYVIGCDLDYQPIERGVFLFKIDFSSDPEKTLQTAFRILRDREQFQAGDKVVIISDVLAQQRVDSIQIRDVPSDDIPPEPSSGKR